MKLRFSLLLLVSAISLAPNVRAQPAVSADSSTVRADYRRALAEMDKGNWREARSLLLDLFKRSPTFDVAASLGEAEAKLGESAKAAQHFAFALKNVPPKEKAETSARIRAGLSSVTGNVATLRLSLNRPEAQLFADGELVGSYPAVSEIYLSPGKHTLEARAGNEAEKREVEAVAGTNTSLVFVLTAQPQPASGLTPPPQATDAPPPSPPAADTPPSESGGNARTIALISGGSLAVAGLAVGIGFGVAANGAEKDADGYRSRLATTACPSGNSDPNCKGLEDALSAQSRDSTIANVGWALGAVGLVTVGVALLWPDERAGQKTTSAGGLSLGWQGNRLLLRGSF
jgi:hypothetical protein